MAELRRLGQEDLAKINDVARKAALTYMRKVYWRMGLEDLQQEAYAAALEAAQKWWDPTCGVPIEGYLWSACSRRLYQYCWRSGSPVSASDHNLPHLRGMHAAAVDDTIAMSGNGVEEEYDARWWDEKVREQVDFLFEDAGMPGMREVAMRVVRDAEKASHVAHDLGLPVNHVYRLARRARVLLAENYKLFSLWREK